MSRFIKVGENTYLNMDLIKSVYIDKDKELQQIHCVRLVSGVKGGEEVYFLIGDTDQQYPCSAICRWIETVGSLDLSEDLTTAQQLAMAVLKGDKTAFGPLLDKLQEDGVQVPPINLLKDS